VNFILNFMLFSLPILTIIVNPLCVLPLLVVHWFSYVRSPEPAEQKGRVKFLAKKSTLVCLQIVLCFAAYFLVSYDIPTISELTLWAWLSG
jgi:hypothetical protein